MNTWIVCGNRSGAKIYSCQEIGRGIRLIENIPNPDGRLKEHELVSDHGGMKSAGSKSTTHGANSKKSAKIQVLDQFVHKLADKLAHELEAKQFDALILCADPKFLGKIRKKIAKNVEQRVVGSLPENFYNDESELLFAQVKGLIQTAGERNWRTA